MFEWPRQIRPSSEPEGPLVCKIKSGSLDSIGFEFANKTIYSVTIVMFDLCFGKPQHSFGLQHSTEEFAAMHRFFSGDQPSDEFFRLFAHSMKNLAIKHMREHKWWKSEKAGFDLGRAALDDWERQYWWCFTHFRRLEHVEGDQCWIEFNGLDYAIVKNVQAFTDLLKQILEMMKRHTKSAPGENQNIIEWAIANPHVCFERVFQFLMLIDINSARFNLPEQWKNEAMAA